MIAITRYSRNRMRAWRFEYLRLPKTQDAYSALWTHWWFAQTIFANSLSQEDLNPSTQDFSLMTTQQRKSVIWDLLCCQLLLLLDWPERRLTLKRIVRWRQRGNIEIMVEPLLWMNESKDQMKFLSLVLLSACHHKICRWTKLFSITSTVKARNNSPDCLSKEQTIDSLNCFLSFSKTTVRWSKNDFSSMGSKHTSA